MPITPYERLRRTAHEFALAVKYPKNRLLWEYPKSAVIDITGFPEAIRALDTVGYDMQVVVTHKGGLEFRAVEKRPTEPWELRV